VFDTVIDIIFKKYFLIENIIFYFYFKIIKKNLKFLSI
jgi:hypothetical protein